MLWLFFISIHVKNNKVDSTLTIAKWATTIIAMNMVSHDAVNHADRAIKQLGDERIKGWQIQFLNFELKEQTHYTINKKAWHTHMNHYIYCTMSFNNRYKYFGFIHVVDFLRFSARANCKFQSEMDCLYKMDVKWRQMKMNYLVFGANKGFIG